MDQKNLELKAIYAEAVNNQQKGNFETAENLYQKILKVNPNHINTQNNLGALFMQMGNNKKAMELLQKVLVDRIAEPTRKQFIPGLDEVRAAALESGALGAGISGSGPSIFALCQDETKAERAGQAMDKVFQKMDIITDLYVRPIAQAGAGAELLHLD